jgi:squalene-hopene/tetraprenyl-beta-curcumene cyclase
LGLGWAVACGTAWAADAPPAAGSRGALDQAVAKALDYLRTKGQAADGSYSAQSGPAVTALVTTAMLRSGVGVNDPAIVKSLKYLEQFVRPDGGIYAENSSYQNYETCLAIMCLTEANRGGRYDQAIKAADAFIRKLQWDEGESKNRADTAYGGAGYGSKKRADLSNTSYLIDALKAAGAGPEDPALQKALLFISRCQNLETEHNTTPHAAKNPDGGFYYTADAGGDSQAGRTDAGGLRSYASMTYAGLKSMIFAGVGPDDPRVRAAFSWIQKNYDLTSNPGMGDSGLYYYYHTFAKALDAIGQDQIVDADGQAHDWRRELIAELAGRQQPGGAWTNANPRWLEGDANLSTGYALLALSYCRPQPRAAR